MEEGEAEEGAGAGAGAEAGDEAGDEEEDEDGAMVEALRIQGAMQHRFSCFTQLWRMLMLLHGKSKFTTLGGLENMIDGSSWSRRAC